MGRTLHLTSPHMTGQDVTALQTILTSHGYLSGKIDGEYGPHTAQAVFRAMYRLGYPLPSQSVGRVELLTEYLLGKKRSLTMRVRANRRARKSPWGKPAVKNALTHGELIVQRALTQIGQTEDPPQSNRSKFSLAYGIVGPWCAMFVTWTYSTLGFSKKTFLERVRYSYVPYVVADAHAGRNGLMVAAGPADGVLVCFDWDGDHTADHIGICVEQPTLRKLNPQLLAKAIAEMGALTGSDFWTVEGNTGVGNDSNGGEVMIRRRNRSQVENFIRVAA